MARIKIFIIFVVLFPCSVIADNNKYMPEELIIEWGYKPTDTYRYDTTYCYSRTFNPDYSKVQSTRDHEIIFNGIDERKISLQGVGQYTIIVEQMENEYQAELRWNIMNQKNNRTTRFEKNCLLREAFLLGKNIFIVSRVRYWDDGWQDLLKRLRIYARQQKDLEDRKIRNL